MRESFRRDLILVVLTLVIAGLLFTLSRQGSRRVAAAPIPRSRRLDGDCCQYGDTGGAASARPADGGCGEHGRGTRSATVESAGSH